MSYKVFLFFIAMMIKLNADNASFSIGSINDKPLFLKTTNAGQFLQDATTGWLATDKANIMYDPSNKELMFMTDAIVGDSVGLVKDLLYKAGIYKYSVSKQTVAAVQQYLENNKDSIQEFSKENPYLSAVAIAGTGFFKDSIVDLSGKFVKKSIQNVQGFAYKGYQNILSGVPKVLKSLGVALKANIAIVGPQIGIATMSGLMQYYWNYKYHKAIEFFNNNDPNVDIQNGVTMLVTQFPDLVDLCNPQGVLAIGFVAEIMNDYIKVVRAVAQNKTDSVVAGMLHYYDEEIFTFIASIVYDNHASYGYNILKEFLSDRLQALKETDDQDAVKEIIDALHSYTQKVKNLVLQVLDSKKIYTLALSDEERLTIFSNLGEKRSQAYRPLLETQKSSILTRFFKKQKEEDEVEMLYDQLAVGFKTHAQKDGLKMACSLCTSLSLVPASDRKDIVAYCALMIEHVAQLSDKNINISSDHRFFFKRDLNSSWFYTNKKENIKNLRDNVCFWVKYADEKGLSVLSCLAFLSAQLQDFAQTAQLFIDQQSLKIQAEL